MTNKEKKHLQKLMYEYGFLKKSNLRNTMICKSPAHRMLYEMWYKPIKNKDLNTLHKQMQEIEEYENK